ncbi:hypothetical protein Gogos_015353 [Gossypium gossypioides]|uniref:Matrin-type domain-containing protein n=1 Tax=Gossypium gossypioides TaxID=34282 RepID=A0A7J9C1F3_GOSGO|nr:hypothetical protein [Gossypium gossypioides]
MSICFSQHTPLEKLDKKHFAKGSHGPRQNGSAAVSQDINSLKHIALMEAKMKKLSDLLSKVSWLLTLPLTVFGKNVKHERKPLQKYVAAVCSPDMVTIVDGFNYYSCDLLQTIEQTKENVYVAAVCSPDMVTIVDGFNYYSCDLLQTIEQTKENVVKKQALTYEEMEQEREEEETQVDTESDDEDQQIYNPLKLPMGWDGKPIPYWLYKLHGLGQEFKCEICGNYSYWGRRAFERHFKEWRHQHGMRCLGIPNTKNFNEITNIQEAQELWEKIRERQGVNKWRPDLEEEYEDKEGNIYNKKTYTDLQRQGLI